MIKTYEEARLYRAWAAFCGIEVEPPGLTAQERDRAYGDLDPDERSLAEQWDAYLGIEPEVERRFADNDVRHRYEGVRAKEAEACVCGRPLGRGDLMLRRKPVKRERVEELRAALVETDAALVVADAENDAVAAQSRPTWR